MSSAHTRVNRIAAQDIDTFAFLLDDWVYCTSHAVSCSILAALLSGRQGRALPLSFSYLVSTALSLLGCVVRGDSRSTSSGFDRSVDETSLARIEECGDHFLAKIEGCVGAELVLLKLRHACGCSGDLFFVTLLICPAYSSGGFGCFII